MRRRAFLGLTGGAMLTQVVGCATMAKPDEPLIAAIDLAGAPGAAVSVVRAGRPLVMAGKGRRRFDAPAAPDADTLFEIGSLTKTFTASLIFELEAEGRLRVEEPVGHYLADLPEAWRAARLDALLSHTAGLPEYLDAGNFMDLMPRNPAPRELLAMAASKPMTFAPGTAHAYNNTGFILLGLVAEAVGGADYWDQLDRRFLRPAGMRRTGPRGRTGSAGNIASGRFWDGEVWNDDPPISAPGSTWAAGGLCSTARDLARWAMAMDEGRVLSPQVRERMWRPAQLSDGSPAGWGFGWVVEQIDGRRVVSHGGGTAGFSCWLRRETETPLTTIILTNQNGRADPLTMTHQLIGAIDAQG